MANRFTVRRGASTPTSSNLLAYELGYNTTNDTLYIGREGKSPYQLNYDVLPIEKGGTGVKTLDELAQNLDVEPAFDILSIEKGGTNASTAEEARNNLGITLDNLGAEPSFDILPIEKGGTGNKVGNASTATKLETARSLSVNLESNDSASFDGSGDKIVGVAGVLPIANGGTAKGTRAEAIENLISGGYITDAETALSVGTYSTNPQTANLPFATYGTLFTYKPDQNWIVQIWTSTNSAETCLYIRKNTNGDGFGSWFKVFGNDMVLTIAQGGTGATKLEDVQKNFLDGTYPAEGTDISALAPGVYCLPNNTTTAMNAPLDAWSPLSVVLGHRDSSNGDDGYPTGAYFQMFVDWDGNLWLRRRKWNAWGNWIKYYNSNNIDIQVGTLAVSTNGTTLTFPRAFAGTPVVTANSSNQTSVKVENVSATNVKLTAGTSGSTVQWQAIYIPS